MEKILLIAFGPQEAARADSDAMQANGFNAFANSPDRLIVELLVFHDSARPNVLAAQFELRLDEDEKCGAGFCHRNCGRDYLPDRNERNIDHHEVDAFGKVLHAQLARIPLDWNYPRILPQLPVKLFDGYIDRVNAFCAVL